MLNSQADNFVEVQDLGYLIIAYVTSTSSEGIIEILHFCRGVQVVLHVGKTFSMSVLF
jgi:hypothetical protein